MCGSNLLFIFTGSIAAYKACEVVSRLVQSGHQMRVVATESALKFVGPATFEGLTNSPVLSDAFETGAALDHINLTRWADAVIMCPATAATLNRLAAGLADDLVGALFLAHDRRKPWLVAPAMNPEMWSHPATRVSVARLREWGILFIEPGEGRTACGEIGAGRLAEPVEIVGVVETLLAPPPARRLRVLVTAGGTREPIDGVRVLTNTSTGATGVKIATHFARRGHEVTLLRASSAVSPEFSCEQKTFESFADLDAALSELLMQGRHDAVIHAAAVSDFSVEPPGHGEKLSSSEPAVLRLKPNPKLVDTLRTRSPQPIRVVAFKLTHGAAHAVALGAVEALFAHAGADWIVHNDLVQKGADADNFPSVIYAPGCEVAAKCATRGELASQLEHLLVSN